MLLVFVQTLEFDVSASELPAEMEPTAGVGGAAGAEPVDGAVVPLLVEGVRRTGVLVVGVLVTGALVTGALVAGVAAAPAGTSFSCGWTVVSFAIARSFESDESALNAVVSDALSALLHAANATAAHA